MCPSIDLCVQCDLTVDEASKSFMCDRCNQWVHCDCAGIHDEVYSAMKKFPVTPLSLRLSFVSLLYQKNVAG